MAELLTGVLAVGQRASAPLRHPAGRRAVLVIEVAQMNGPVRFEVETSDDGGATWTLEHRADLEAPGRSVHPMRRGVLMRVRKSGARCTAAASTDSGNVEP